MYCIREQSSFTFGYKWLDSNVYCKNWYALYIQSVLALFEITASMDLKRNISSLLFFFFLICKVPTLNFSVLNCPTHCDFWRISGVLLCKDFKTSIFEIGKLLHRNPRGPKLMIDSCKHHPLFWNLNTLIGLQSSTFACRQALFSAFNSDLRNKK